MKHVFTPKNYWESFRYFLSIPSYRFLYFLKKKDLVFQESEVVSIERHPVVPTLFRINFSTKTHEGDFAWEGDGKEIGVVPLYDVAKIKKDYWRNQLRSILSFRSTESWIFFLSLTFVVGFYFFYQPELMVNSFCDIKCIKVATIVEGVLIFFYGLFLLWLLVSIACYFYLAKHIRNAQVYTGIRQGALFSGCISIIMLSILAQNYQKSIVWYRLKHTPDYFKNSINRKIASEIIGVEIKDHATLETKNNSSAPKR